MNQQAAIVKVRRLHRQAAKDFRSFLETSREVGEILYSIKELPKGESWLEFCTVSWPDIGIRSLQVSMRIARNWEVVQKASSISQALVLITELNRRGFPPRRFGFNAVYRLFRASIKDCDKEERETLLRQPHLLQDSLRVLRQRIHRMGLRDAA